MSMIRNHKTRLLALAGSLILLACQPSVPPAPRNLVVICLDTVRYDSFINREIEDQLTRWMPRAQRFSNTMSPAPWTMPSVASLFTGHYPVEHGAGQFKAEIANLDKEIPSALVESATTLAEILNANYFRTGAFVSHPFFKADLGLRQGFQQIHNRRGWFRDVDRFWQWADRIKPPNRFLGYLHFMEAHHRHTGSNQELVGFLATVDPSTTEYLHQRHPKNCADPESRRCLQSLVYDVSVLELRSAVATVLDDLEQKGILDDTLVLVYSDHGEEFWDHEEIQLRQGLDPRKNIGLGHGQNMFQELLHVPLLVWHPALEGKVHEEPVSLIDALPSLLKWMEIEAPEVTLTGELLPPLTRNWFRSADDRRIFSSGIAYGPEQIATRQGSIKSIFRMDNDGFELYDLENDPLERDPVVDDGLVLEFETYTGDYLEMKRLVHAARGQVESSELDELKAIGYLQGVEETQQEHPDTDSPGEKDEQN